MGLGGQWQGKGENQGGRRSRAGWRELAQADGPGQAGHSPQGHATGRESQATADHHSSFPSSPQQSK